MALIGQQISISSELPRKEVWWKDLQEKEIPCKVASSTKLTSMASLSASRPCIGRLLRPHELQLGTSLITQSAVAQATTRASFSTTTPQCKRKVRHSKTRDNNRFRGVSLLRRTGLRGPVSVSDEPLPRPAAFLPKLKVDPNHGLYAFFAGKDKLMNTPAEDREHGRAWTVEELRKKSWDDLQKLWWVCCRERNRISTADYERKRAKMGFGAAESKNRDDAVKQTMKSIKHVLTERYYLWEDAHELAKSDPEINLSGQGDVYVPIEDQQFFEEEEAKAKAEEADAPKPAPAT
ncbi:hypothetical protein jhhlp_003523 [Lomentospora prolificans]|uniref:Large ribosomal subunit protein uL29m n=1 Tax=Lomentospora prolificans TaxID=41688 RepID=A0A2N3N8Z8_9PEZI|nr:hypothetical protein jhhlp_003523 [Lomentospora prolificans]